ncbi:lamin tail domain-containing protein 1 isoform X2 [Tiliqua scincoides]|uniref:lamin tail domain-containing protein 1 isoform X2 n=1 Tax=Tiliqua scincoides TaxID=71010 RepID=UPI00346295F2
MIYASCSTGFLLQKQHIPYSSSSSTETDLLGQGQDYVRSLFADSRKTDLEGKVRRLNASAEYLSSITSSAVGNLKIVEVHPNGLYMKILNTSPDQEESIGGHTLQQNLYGHPVLTFHFPPKIRMKAGSRITVWAACSEMPHKPPSDFLWKECKRFKFDPVCTTILCNPNGQAVAWYTPINWNQKQTKAEEKSERPLKNIRPPRIPQPKDNLEARTISAWQANAGKSPAEKTEPEFIVREEKTPPNLYPMQSAWCQSPNASTHPHYSIQRRGDGRPTSSLGTAHPLQSGPPPGILYTEGTYGMKSATGSGRGKTRTRPIRSAGPNLGGVIYIGSAAPIGSALQKFLAHSSPSCRLLAQASLLPTHFL